MLESPWPILIVGLAAETLLAVALFRTGKGKLLWAMGSVAVVVALVLLVERNTVTDTKLVRQTLEETAAGLVANSADRAKACIVPGPDGDAGRGMMNWAPGSGAEFPRDFHSQSRCEVQSAYEPAQRRNRFHGLRSRQGSRRRICGLRRNRTAGEHESPVAEGVGPLADLWRPEARRARVGPSCRDGLLWPTKARHGRYAARKKSSSRQEGPASPIGLTALCSNPPSCSLVPWPRLWRSPGFSSSAPGPRSVK